MEGFDKIIPRHKLRDEIYNLLSILLKLKEKEEVKDRNVTIDKSRLEKSLNSKKSVEKF